MGAHELASKARKHWAQWLPKWTARLKADGTFSMATMRAGQAAQQRINDLMATGYRPHEAEEVALKEYILLDPEAQDDWESEELAEKEAEYQHMMRNHS